MAVPESLQKLLEDGVVDEVQQRLMSGKEASVYVVSHRGQIVAAKVYKARDRRTFKSTSSYTEGRNQTRNTRDKRAMDRGSSYGKSQMEDSWRDMEYRALFDAHNAGVRVPKPILLYEDVLLMELLVDANDAPAPRLADVDLTGDEAKAMLNEVYRQVRLLLGAGRVHGDLSAFNILMAAAGPTIIDLPQVVDAAGNNQAQGILVRDLRNVVEHLSRFDERLLRFLECGETLFQHYRRGTLDEATEPREVRREHGGGRRMRGQERPEGFQAQPRRGPPPQQQWQQRDARAQQQQGRPPQQQQQQRAPQPSGVQMRERERGNASGPHGPSRNGPPGSDARDPRAQPRGFGDRDRNGPPRNGPRPPGPASPDHRTPGPGSAGPRFPDARSAQRGPDPRSAQRGPDPRSAQRGPDPRSAQRGPDPRGPDHRDRPAEVEVTHRRNSGPKR